MKFLALETRGHLMASQQDGRQEKRRNPSRWWHVPRVGATQAPGKESWGGWGGGTAAWPGCWGKSEHLGQGRAGGNAGAWRGHRETAAPGMLRQPHPGAGKPPAALSWSPSQLAGAGGQDGAWGHAGSGGDLGKKPSAPACPRCTSRTNQS